MGGDPDDPEGSLEAIGFRGSGDYPPPKRGKGVPVWVAGFLAVVAGTAAIMVTVVLPGSAARTAAAGPVPPKGSPEDAVQVTTAFLQGWQRGDNDNNETFPDGTPFITDFAQSCNNAFGTQWTHLSGLLASTAQTYFGLNQAWNIGIAGQSASYFSAPADASGSELAQEAYGEGQLLASPLAMASVAATVDTGMFRQPYLLPGTPQVTATALPASTDAQLQQMMQAVVTSGTAAPVGFGPGVYAKTGTADVAGQDQPNSWLIAFDPAQNIAVACLVIDAGYGAQYAGLEVKAFLSRY